MKEWGQKDLADWDLPQRLRPGWDSEVIHSHVHDQGPLKLLPRISASLEDPRPSPTPHGSLGGHLVVTSDLSQKPSHSQASVEACSSCLAALHSRNLITPG